MGLIRFALVSALCFVFFAGESTAQDFSVDLASPEAWLGGDVVESPGAPALYTAAELGLAAGVEVDAISDGIDDPRLYCLTYPGVKSYYYSVDRGSDGQGGVVTAEGLGNGNAGDKFRWDLTCVTPFLDLVNPPFQQCDAPDCLLTPEPAAPLSNIDALDYGVPAGGPVYLPPLIWRQIDPLGIYFSVENGSAPPGIRGCDILYQPFPGPAPPPWVVYATCEQLGLQGAPADEIDALALFDVAAPDLLNPGDLVWFSLQAGSPSLADPPCNLGGPSDIFMADLWYLIPAVAGAIDVPAAYFDLGANDDLDALTVIDPGGSNCMDNVDQHSDGTKDAPNPHTLAALDPSFQFDYLNPSSGHDWDLTCTTYSPFFDLEGVPVPEPSGALPLAVAVGAIALVASGARRRGRGI